MNWRWIGGVLAVTLVAIGCDQSGSKGSGPGTATAATPPPPPADSRPKPVQDPAPSDAREVVYHLARAQTNLPRASLFVGPHEIESELCTSVTQVATGLMHRESIGTNDTMFFVFATGDQRSFYMKNVKFPIAAAYIDTEGVIDEIVQLKAMEVTPVPSKSHRIQYVLETAPDWFERNKVGPGDKVSTPNGPLKSTLARRAVLP